MCWEWEQWYKGATQTGWPGVRSFQILGDFSERTISRGVGHEALHGQTRTKDFSLGSLFAFQQQQTGSMCMCAHTVHTAQSILLPSGPLTMYIYVHILIYHSDIFTKYWTPFDSLVKFFCFFDFLSFLRTAHNFAINKNAIDLNWKIEKKHTHKSKRQRNVIALMCFLSEIDCVFLQMFNNFFRSGVSSDTNWVLRNRALMGWTSLGSDNEGNENYAA